MSYTYEERERPAGLDGLWRGVIASSPAATTDLVDVTIPGFTDTLRWPGCRWEPHVKAQIVNVAEGVEAAHTITVGVVELPVRGDVCLIGFDDNGDPWVVMWRSA